MICVVCKKNKGWEMTDGKDRGVVCDECRTLVNTFFFVYGSLLQALREATLAKTGKDYGEVHEVTRR